MDPPNGKGLNLDYERFQVVLSSALIVEVARLEGAVPSRSPGNVDTAVPARPRAHAHKSRDPSRTRSASYRAADSRASIERALPQHHREADKQPRDDESLSALVEHLRHLLTKHTALPYNTAAEHYFQPTIGARCRLSDTAAQLMASELQKPKKDRRVARTQKLLRDAFTSLLREKRFESISVQDIAERAIVNRATFYAHFQDKFDLFESLIRERFQQKLAEGDPRNEQSIDRTLYSLTMNVSTFMDQAGHCKLDKMLWPRLQSTLHEELRAHLAQWLNDAAALVASSAMIAAALDWRRDDAKLPADGIARQIVDVLLRGIAKEVSPDSSDDFSQSTRSRGDFSIINT
jgi:AcrR family transcriptional regulator